MRTIWWDMDGTIANLYGVENWLALLWEEDTTPYTEAEVIGDLSQLIPLMNQVQKLGYKLGVISWARKDSPTHFYEAVKQAKLTWLKEHFTSVSWDLICIERYGTPKSLVMQTEDDILFDDEERNRDAWLGEAYEPDMMIKVLKALLGRY